MCLSADASCSSLLPALCGQGGGGRGHGRVKITLLIPPVFMPQDLKPERDPSLLSCFYGLYISFPSFLVFLKGHRTALPERWIEFGWRRSASKYKKTTAGIFKRHLGAQRHSAAVHSSISGMLMVWNREVTAAAGDLGYAASHPRDLHQRERAQH